MIRPTAGRRRPRRRPPIRPSDHDGCTARLERVAAELGAVAALCVSCGAEWSAEAAA